MVSGVACDDEAGGDALTGGGDRIKGVLVPHPARLRRLKINKRTRIVQGNMENFDPITGVVAGHAHG